MREIATFEDLEAYHKDFQCLHRCVEKIFSTNAARLLPSVGRKIIILEEEREYVGNGLLCPLWVSDPAEYFSEENPPTSQDIQQMQAWEDFTVAFINLAKTCYVSQVASQIAEEWKCEGVE